MNVLLIDISPSASQSRLSKDTIDQPGIRIECAMLWVERLEATLKDFKETFNSLRRERSCGNQEKERQNLHAATF